jgi:voltage-gated potassium channel
MLIGLIWTSFYLLLVMIDPQALKGLPDPSSHDVRILSTLYMDLIYFSYVTLSTLGYGDITPVSRAAQSLAYLEAISGVMYVAVLVAAMVGSYGKKPTTRH